MKHFLFVLLVFQGACASLSYHNHQAHRLYNSGDCLEAALLYEKAASASTANKLLYLLDQATALVCARDYQSAVKVFLEAEKIAQVKDYTSISEELGAAVVSDNVRSYTGEDFEKVLINVYLALSFASMGQHESALVEARKINQILNRMITEGKLPYEESPFARYLSALLWESAGEWNDAYIDYVKTYELAPHFPGIGEDLIRSASKINFHARVKKWKKKFPGDKKNYLAKNEGELILFYQRGKSPVKVPRRGDLNALPRFQDRFYHKLKLRLTGNSFSEESQAVVLDISSLSKKYLNKKLGKLAGKKILRSALKGALAIAAAKVTKDKDLGWLSFYALMAADQEDLRSWQTLPAEIVMLRKRLVEGRYDLRLELLLPDGSLYESILLEKEFIRAGKKNFLFLR